MTPRLCAAIVREHVGPSCGKATLGCPALAAEGSPFCPAHRDLKQGRKRTRQAAVDRDVDVLPWQPADQAIFREAALRRAGRRAVRRAR